MLHNSLMSSPSPILSAYLDNCIAPSGMVNNQIEQAELDALIELFRREEAGTVSLCTSEVTKEEIARIPASARVPFEDVYAGFERVPMVAEEFRLPKLLTSMRSGVTSGPIVEDAKLGSLRDILPDLDDARHVYQAVCNGDEYFVTRDQKSILAHAEAVKAAVGITLCWPSDLVEELDRRGLK